MKCKGVARFQTYKRNNIVAKRHFRRALPLHFYGTFLAVSEAQQNMKEFFSVFRKLECILDFLSGTEWWENLDWLIIQYQSFECFAPLLEDSAIGVAESPTIIRFYRVGDVFHHNITNFFDMTESTVNYSIFLQFFVILPRSAITIQSNILIAVSIFNLNFEC